MEASREPGAGSYRELVPVFAGSLSEATVLRSALAARGFDTVIPSENIKVVQPFLTGANALWVTLLAPEDRAGAVRAEIEALRRGDHSIEDSEEAEDERRPDLETLGARVRWSVLLVATIPVGAVLGLIYARRSAGVTPRPRHHGLTVAAAAYATLVTLGGLLLAVGFAAGLLS